MAYSGSTVFYVSKYIADCGIPTNTYRFGGDIDGAIKYAKNNANDDFYTVVHWHDPHTASKGGTVGMW